MNIIDYIQKHKDESFQDFPFTEVDSLILSLLPYISFDNIIPYKKRKAKTLKDVANYLNKNNVKPKFLFTRNVYKMIDIMKDTKRYSNIYLYHYLNIVNEEMQFSALSMVLPTKSIYIAFAGTDTSIIGWEEDFKLAYLYPGISQKYAANYLNKTIGIFDSHVILGGHSKGGNLAIAAAMNTRFYIKSRITGIDNFDGPGFLKEQFESKEYEKIKNKIRMYVPKDSIIGMLLYHVSNYEVIKSKGFNIMQHDAFNWLCKENAFIRDKQTKRSLNLQKKITEKLESLSPEKRMEIVKNLFDIFKKKNITNTENITIKEIFELIKDFIALDKDTQNWLVEFLLILFIK